MEAEIESTVSQWGCYEMIRKNQQLGNIFHIVEEF